jgi:hypothetical protein
MGGGASAVLQETMGEAYLREYAGDRFDEAKFSALCDENGEVSKCMLLDTVSDGIPREVYMTYMSYCPSGLMSLHAYVTIIRNAKFLSKKCNRMTAETVFHGARFAVGEKDMHINYYTFIKDIIPRLAEQRETTFDQLFDKLAFIELGTGQEIVPEIMDSKPTSLAGSLFQATAAVAGHSGKISPASAAEEAAAAAAAEREAGAVAGKPSEQDRAATLLQKKARARTAKREAEQRREVRDKDY